MERISVADAAAQFTALVDRITSAGICVELERDNRVVAWIAPARDARPMLASDLPSLFARLPQWGDDAEDFAQDIDELRRLLPQETGPWD